MTKPLLLFIFTFYSTTLLADYYSEHETGWYWFDDPAPETAQAHLNKRDKITDPSERVDQARLKIKQALDQAIIDPSPLNIKHYIELQNQMSEQANRFANTWQEVLLATPQLNYSLLHPTNTVGLQVYNESQSRQKIEALEKFSAHSGLFFFYRSTCPYCKRFAPILKHFADVHHIAIVPITLDGLSLPEFPNSKKDEGQARKFNVTVEPSLYAVDPSTQKAYPVAYGLVSETELLNNIYNIMTHYKAGLS